MPKKNIRNGTVLLAEPFMVDPNFKRAVLLLCEHHNEGSVGFILNKSIDMKINELIVDFPEFDSDVYFGGPVQTDTIHYIHSVGELLEDSQKISDGVYWGGDFEKLKFLISSELVMPKDIRFFVGYSGWTKDQLTDEMKYGSWVPADMHANYLFKSPIEDLWKQVMGNIGDTYSVIAQLPDSASWN